MLGQRVTAGGMAWLWWAWRAKGCLFVSVDYSMFGWLMDSSHCHRHSQPTHKQNILNKISFSHLFHPVSRFYRLFASLFLLHMSDTEQEKMSMFIWLWREKIRNHWNPSNLPLSSYSRPKTNPFTSPVTPFLHFKIIFINDLLWRHQLNI